MRRAHCAGHFFVLPPGPGPTSFWEVASIAPDSALKRKANRPALAIFPILRCSRATLALSRGRHSPRPPGPGHTKTSPPHVVHGEIYHRRRDHTHNHFTPPKKMNSNFDESTLFKWVAHTGTRISSLYSEYLVQEFGLGINEWRILLFAKKQEKSTIGEICADALIHKSVVSRAVQHLEEKHLLRVTRTKRHVSVALTAAGKSFLIQTEPSVREKECALVRGVSSEDARTVARVLEHIASQLDVFAN